VAIRSKGGGGWFTGTAVIQHPRAPGTFRFELFDLNVLIAKAEIGALNSASARSQLQWE